jgi:hypothetical protein
LATLPAYGQGAQETILNFLSKKLKLLYQSQHIL